MLTCLITDLDGTVFDSREANVAAYAQAFADAGFEFDATAYHHNFGLRFPEMITALAPEAGEDVKRLIREKKADYYQKNLSMVRPNQALLSLLQSCAGTHKLALVTTASRVNVQNLLNHFSVPEDLFQIIITGEDVQNSKPDPECYTKAIASLGVSADTCCVFEDSQIGIAAAEAAGAHVIRVML
jgi:beta-phosphoglucomutase